MIVGGVGTLRVVLERRAVVVVIREQRRERVIQIQLFFSVPQSTEVLRAVYMTEGPQKKPEELDT